MSADPLARLFRRSEIVLGAGPVRVPKRRRCNRCGTEKSYVNKKGSQEWRYYRDNLYFCKNCGRLILDSFDYKMSFLQRLFAWLESFEQRSCCKCGSYRTYPNKNGAPCWLRCGLAWQCVKCYKRDSESKKAYSKRRIRPGNGKITINCSENPRTGKCDECERSIHNSIITRTNYCIELDRELCLRCHAKLHAEVVLAMRSDGRPIEKYLGNY